MEKSWNFFSEIFVGTLSKKITYFGPKFGVSDTQYRKAAFF